MLSCAAMKSPPNTAPPPADGRATYLVPQRRARIDEVVANRTRTQLAMDAVEKIESQYGEDPRANLKTAL